MRGLRSELDEAKRKASRLNQEHRELSLRLEDTEKDKDTLKQTITQLEESRRQQERALEKLDKEVKTKKQRARPLLYLLQLMRSLCSLRQPNAH